MQQCKHGGMTWKPSGTTCVFCHREWSFEDVKAALIQSEFSPTLQDIADMLKPKLLYMVQIADSLKRIEEDVGAIRREICRG